jgi:hypothetical protein
MNSLGHLSFWERVDQIYVLELKTKIKGFNKELTYLHLIHSPSSLLKNWTRLQFPIQKNYLSALVLWCTYTLYIWLYCNSPRYLAKN